MKKENMLVVEDEDIMREALVDYFSDGGHNVDTANDGEMALEKFNLKDYNIMIIDLRLPGRDGLSILEEVKRKNPKAKVIIITAYPTVETEEEAIRKGASEYIQKPFELTYLETLIKQSYEIDIVPAPPVEEPLVEDLIIAPCIWMQAGIVKKRRCTLGYQCQNVCNFHAAMIKKEKFSDDPRIKPFLGKLASQTGRNECRYTMSGEISARTCSQVYSCENCELHQTIQDEVDCQIAIKAANRKKLQANQDIQAVVKHKPIRADH
ncbi:response regulator [Acidobacteriota bacterium]